MKVDIFFNKFFHIICRYRSAGSYCFFISHCNSKEFSPSVEMSLIFSFKELFKFYR